MSALLIKGEAIRVSGIVQGVGFRPAVWQLARQSELVGRVWNDSEGVMIHVWGKAAALSDFISRLEKEAPPLAQIDSIQRSVLSEELAVPDDFQIVLSQSGLVNTHVAPDAATCPECLKEILDSNNRRYRYAFTNCTHCGPRMSIIRDIPYDRANTSMAAFHMCPQCQQEYTDPADRRFHAQPNACPQCGPKVWLEDRQGQKLPADSDCDIIETAARLIRQGYIVAIKGIGGIHLACNAASHAVQSLRQRKLRYQKPFALMAKDIAMVKGFVNVSPVEEELLNSHAAPIVILQVKAAQESETKLADELAPGQNSLGFLLPYTPLHHLLMQNMTQPVILTSGNQSDEPQIIDNTDCRQKLNSIADYYLLHDRDIVNRLDDSVLRLMDKQLRFLRLARGYAPLSLSLPEDFPESASILAMGGELKNTFCLLKNNKLIVSQYIGDLENTLSFRDYQHNLQLYQQLFDFKPERIAVDRHPDYLSTQLGQQLAAAESIPCISVQHHHAHIVACMLEHGLPVNTGKVLGVALDGLGYGADNTLWGGEFLLLDYQQCRRVASFEPIKMPGGAKAMYEPWRNTLAYLVNAFDWDELLQNYAQLDIIRLLKTKPLNNLKIILEKGLNSPQASSAGRLFDAVAAALGVCAEQAVYEGQAAIELEVLAEHEFESQAEYAYGFSFEQQQIIWTAMWSALLEDLKSKISPAIIAARFHHCVAQAVAGTAISLCSQYSLQTIVLSGGVFQNRLLLERSSDLLREHGLQVLSPLKLPLNDAGLSAGQAVIAALK